LAKSGRNFLKLLANIQLINYVLLVHCNN